MGEGEGEGVGIYNTGLCFLFICVTENFGSTREKDGMERGKEVEVYILVFRWVRG